MTNDKWILGDAKSYKTEFKWEHFQFHIHNSFNFSAIEYEAVRLL